jgi:hypothetical protein
MIEMLGAAGLLAFLASSVSIGIRLLLLGRRTRGVPELTVGTGLLVGCVVGYVPETVVLSSDFLSPEVEFQVLAVTQIAIRAAAVSILIFTWKVFRADATWAKAFASLIAIALVMSWIAFPSTRIHATHPRELFWYDFFAVARTLAIGWGAVESLLYHHTSRKRLRIGLTDPLVTNRFLLWGIGLAAMTMLMASTLLASAFGVDPATPGWVLLRGAPGRPQSPRLSPDSRHAAPLDT